MGSSVVAVRTSRCCSYNILLTLIFWRRMYAIRSIEEGVAFLEYEKDGVNLRRNYLRILNLMLKQFSVSWLFKVKWLGLWRAF